MPSPGCPAGRQEQTKPPLTAGGITGMQATSIARQEPCSGQRPLPCRSRLRGSRRRGPHRDRPTRSWCPGPGGGRHHGPGGSRGRGPSGMRGRSPGSSRDRGPTGGSRSGPSCAHRRPSGGCRPRHRQRALDMLGHRSRRGTPDTDYGSARHHHGGDSDTHALRQATHGFSPSGRSNPPVQRVPLSLVQFVGRGWPLHAGSVGSALRHRAREKSLSRQDPKVPYTVRNYLSSKPYDVWKCECEVPSP